MREADLARPTADWLRSRGFTVYAEVVLYGGSMVVDLVGVSSDEERVVAVELKTSLNWKVVKQAALAQLLGDEAWAVVGRMPRSGNQNLDEARRLGVGAALVSGDRVTTLVEPGGYRRGTEPPAPRGHPPETPRLGAVRRRRSPLWPEYRSCSGGLRPRGPVQGRPPRRVVVLGVAATYQREIDGESPEPLENARVLQMTHQYHSSSSDSINSSASQAVDVAWLCMIARSDGWACGWVFVVEYMNLCGDGEYWQRVADKLVELLESASEGR